MRIVVLFSLLCLVCPGVGQVSSFDSSKLLPVSINLPDTLIFKNLSNDIPKQPFWEKNMPWVVALMIGILSALANVIIANRLRSSNEKNLQKQLQSNKDTSLTQFKATVATKNRQEWINEVRHDLSELLANSALATAEFQSKAASKEVIYKYTERILYCRAKIQMLLNDQKVEQKQVLDAVKLFVDENHIATKDNPNSVKINEAKKQILKSSRELFSIHWKKIKNLE